jgi:glycosyltransferase involved in cell wall biosynthesis
MNINPDRYPKMTALICTLNEEPNLPHVLPRIPAWVSEVLVVDGHSTDRTIEVARKIRPDIRILGQPGRGKGDALRYGIELASGEIIVTLDADGNTDPEELPRFIEPLLNGYDFAKGSRFLNTSPARMPGHRRIGNWILTRVTNIMFGSKYTDMCSGFNAVWKNAWEKVEFPDEFGYEPLITIRAKKAGLKIIEVSCTDRGRINGASKLPSWRQGWGALKAIVRERFHG